MKGKLKYLVIFILPITMLMVSCSSSDKYPDTSALKTVIHEIKIVNGGLSGTETIVGTVNEDTKEISFPEVHMDSDLSKVKFDAVLSEGAALDEAEYDFVVEEGASQRKRTITVVNGTRKREYFVTIRLDVPVWGADFTEGKRKIYNYSGENILPEYSDINARQATISLNNVFIAMRATPYALLLDLAAMREGRLERKEMNIEGHPAGAAGGYGFANGGVLVHGHAYTINMVTSATTGGPFRIAHWEEANFDQPPTVTVFSVNDVPGIELRYDGFLSTDINADGNGFFYVHSNSSAGGKVSNILRLTVSNFTEIGNPVVLAGTTPHPGTWACFNQVNTKDEYIYTGIGGPIKLAASDGNIVYTVPTTVIPVLDAINAQVIEFNQERYLAMISSGAGGVAIYDITQGETTEEALKKLDLGNKVFEFSLGGAIPNGNASVSMDWIADGDETLFMVVAAPQAGLAVFEFPKKVKENQE